IPEQESTMPHTTRYSLRKKTAITDMGQKEEEQKEVDGEWMETQDEDDVEDYMEESDEEEEEEGDEGECTTRQKPRTRAATKRHPITRSSSQPRKNNENDRIQVRRSSRVHKLPTTLYDEWKEAGEWDFGDE